jgi:hypothetical protein
MAHDKNKHQCTMHGLQHWFEAKFEKLGWMAIAKEHGHDLCVRSYLQSISHLKECIKDKWNSIHDSDRKDDLKIMLDHTQTLMTAAHKLLDSKLDPCSNKKKDHSTEQHDATFYGLHKWETKMYEKLGWMVLAKNEGNSLKIKAYMETIHRLKDMLMKKMSQVEEKDRKDDLKILYDDTCILWRAASKLLGKPEGMYGKPEGMYGKPEGIYGKPKGMGGKPEGVGSMDRMESMSSKHIMVHSDEVEPGMVVRVDKKGKKYLTRQSSQSRRKHNKQRHTRTDRDASKKKTKKRSRKNSFSSMMGGFF